MFDTLVDGEDGDVAGAGEAAGVEDGLEVAERGDVAVGLGEDAVDEVGAWGVDAFAGDFGGGVVEEVVGGGAEG